MFAMSPYKTAAELGITVAEHVGLIEVMEKLSGPDPLPVAFNMAYWLTCVGRHLADAIGQTPSAYMGGGASDSFGPLFVPGLGLPGMTENPGWDADRYQGAKAILNFLVLGKPCWDHVMQQA